METAKVETGIIRTGDQIVGGVRVKVYFIRTGDGAELAVTRIKPRPDRPAMHPVVLVHGSYSNRHFFISKKGIGLGVYLAEKGFDVWIPETRGHGLSPKGGRFSAITAEDQIRYDLPAVQNLVADQAGACAFWIGHSFGGLFIIAGLSAGWLRQEQVAGVVTFGSQISLGDGYLKFPPLAWTLSAVLRLIGYLPAPRFGLGPENEPAGTILETIRWKRLGGKWTSSKGFSYWEGLSDIRVPVMAYAAAADRNDPPEGCREIFEKLGTKDKIFIILGKNYRFSKDYGHAGMVVSREAREEVWPDVAGWLADRSEAIENPET